jgi:hypothetical protein
MMHSNTELHQIDVQFCIFPAANFEQVYDL